MFTTINGGINLLSIGLSLSDWPATHSDYNMTERLIFYGAFFWG